MKTIIAGSRTITDYHTLKHLIASVLKSGHLEKITEVVTGCARGVDALGERWANENDVPVKHFPADWDRHGKKAGYIRNAEMAEYADALIAIWDGQSKGTKMMIDIAKSKELLTFVAKIIDDPLKRAGIPESLG